MARSAIFPIEAFQDEDRKFSADGNGQLSRMRLSYLAQSDGGKSGGGGRRQISGNKDNPSLAFIDGVPVAYDEAVQRCADLLAASGQPVFAHLGVDVAGMREAIWLAKLTGGVVDHLASDSLLRDLDPLRETGGFTTTPLEADVRADLVLLIGDVKSDPALEWLTRPARPYGEPIERRELVLSGGEGSLKSLASLRLNLKRPGEWGGHSAEMLRTAKFGVAIWRAADLPALAVEAVHGLVRDLNETIRFSTLALSAPDNGLGVQAVCGWMTGYPLRVGFGRGWPEHDSWLYDARRIIAAGETDCIVWVSSLPDGAPPPDRVDIVIDDGRAALASVPSVRIALAPSSLGGVIFDSRMGAFVGSPSGLAGSAAAALAAVRARLEFARC